VQKGGSGGLRSQPESRFAAASSYANSRSPVLEGESEQIKLYFSACGLIAISWRSGNCIVPHYILVIKVNFRTLFIAICFSHYREHLYCSAVK